MYSWPASVSPNTPRPTLNHKMQKSQTQSAPPKIYRADGTQLAVVAFLVLFLDFLYVVLYLTIPYILPIFNRFVRFGKFPL